MEPHLEDLVNKLLWVNKKQFYQNTKLALFIWLHTCIRGVGDIKKSSDNGCLLYHLHITVICTWYNKQTGGMHYVLGFFFYPINGIPAGYQKIHRLWKFVQYFECLAKCHHFLLILARETLKNIIRV